jgi:hypothetical protein
MTDDNKTMMEIASNEELIQTNISDTLNEEDTNTSKDTIVADISLSNNSSKVEDINASTVDIIDDVNVIHQSEHVNSWWKGGGNRSLIGTLQLTRQTILTHDKKDRRTVAFLNWSHSDNSNTNNAEVEKPVSGTMKIRHALTIRKKQKG